MSYAFSKRLNSLESFECPKLFIFIMKHFFLMFYKNESKTSHKDVRLNNYKWVLYHKNASCHPTILINVFLVSKSIRMTLQPPYMSDLIPYNFFIFWRLKIISSNVILGHSKILTINHTGGEQNLPLSRKIAAISKILSWVILLCYFTIFQNILQHWMKQCKEFKIIPFTSLFSLLLLFYKFSK